MEGGRQLKAGRRSYAVLSQFAWRCSGGHTSICIIGLVAYDILLFNLFSAANSRVTSSRCGGSSRRAICWLRRSKLSSRMAQCHYIPGLLNMARSVVSRPISLPNVELYRPSDQLRNGQLVTIPPILVRRLKSHFLTLPCGVDLILGLNGYIWVRQHVKENEQEGEEGFDAEAVYSNVNDVRIFFFANIS